MFQQHSSHIFIFLIVILALTSGLTGATPPKITTFVHQQNLPTGSSFLLTCSVYQGSSPLLFKWLKNGLEFSSSSRLSIETKNQFSFFNIPEVKPSDGGNYSCSVSNSNGRDSQWAFLSVKGQYSFPKLRALILRLSFWCLSLFFYAVMWRYCLSEWIQIQS